MNTLYYGDNLKILREHIATESVDLIYLDPPFNSNRNYNVLFKNESGAEAESQITAFEDTWHWNRAAEETYRELISEPDQVGRMIEAFRGFISGRGNGIRLSSLLGCLWVLCALFSDACAQRNLKEVTNKDEISIKFQHVAKSGETKSYLIGARQIPNAPAVPNGYKLFENKAYYLKTQTIDLGDPIVSFKIPSNEYDFKRLRILQLLPEELVPNSYAWRDCSMSEDNVWQVPPYNKEEAGSYLPNYATKTVNCHIKTGLKPDQYFAVVLQAQPPPTKPFTDLTFEIEGSERQPRAGNVSYDLTLRNSGQKNIGELNIMSSFNSTLTSMAPEHGKCVRSDWGFGGGTAVCYLGELPVNGKVKIHFDVSIVPQLVEPPNRFYWDVYAVIKETPDDAIWPANQFSFSPLTDK